MDKTQNRGKAVKKEMRFDLRLKQPETDFQQPFLIGQNFVLFFPDNCLRFCDAGLGHEKIGDDNTEQASEYNRRKEQIIPEKKNIISEDHSSGDASDNRSRDYGRRDDCQQIFPGRTKADGDVDAYADGDSDALGKNETLLKPEYHPAA